MPKPVIGINCDLNVDEPAQERLVLNTDYFDAVRQGGGLPMLIPFLDDAGDIASALDVCDGLLLTGGGDLDPSLFDQKLGAPGHKSCDVSSGSPGARAGGLRGAAWPPVGVTGREGDEQEPSRPPEGRSPYGSAPVRTPTNMSPNLRTGALSPKAKLAHPRRRRFDQLLARAALQRDMPILCICTGMQLVNLLAGGTLMQDIETERPGSLQHRNPEKIAEAHAVNVAPDSHLARIVGTEPLGVNSTHHQAIGDVAPGFRVSSRAEDGVIEAIESIAANRVIGVQWHPERMRQNRRHLAFFRWLVAQAGIQRGV